MDVIHEPAFQFLDETMQEVEKLVMLEPVKIIMLDVDNTLLDFNRCTISCAEKADIRVETLEEIREIL